MNNHIFLVFKATRSLTATVKFLIHLACLTTFCSVSLLFFKVTLFIRCFFWLWCLYPPLVLLLPLTFLSSPHEGLLFPWRRIWCWYFLWLSLCSPCSSIYLANFVTCLSFIYSACDKKSQIYSCHLNCFPGSRSNYLKTSQLVSWSLVLLVSKPVSINKLYFLKIILSTLLNWSLIIISHCLTESWSLLSPLILVKMHVSEVPLLSWWSFIHSTPSIYILSFNLASLNISFQKTFPKTV